MKQTGILLAISIIFLAINSLSFAESNLDLWMPVTLDIPVDQTTSMRLEAQNRWHLDTSDFDLIQIRPSIAKQLTKTTTCRAGYLWGRTSPQGSHEHRPWGECLVEMPIEKLGNIELIYRQRNELRWVSGAGSPALRSRHLAGVYVPVTDKTGINLNNELLFHLVDNEQTDGGFDQNRIHFGLEHQFHSEVSGELAYRFIIADQSSVPSHQYRHVIYAQLNLSLPSIKNDHHL